MSLRLATRTAAWVGATALGAIALALSLRAFVPTFPRSVEVGAALVCALVATLIVWRFAPVSAQTGTTVTPEQLSEAMDAVARAERALRSATPPPIPGRATPWPFFIVAVAALLLVASVMTLPSRAVRDEDEHIHVTFGIFVGPERLRFLDPSFDYAERRAPQGHLHLPTDAVLHIEGPRATTFAAAVWNAVGVAMRPDALDLAHAFHGGRILATDPQHPLRAYVEPAGGAPREIAPSSYDPEDGDRILVVYGTLTQAELDAAWAQIPRVADALREGG